ncbi:MAG: 23S rRNA (guanosine(2251)-2'-O)-methyltransferase RlmB [Clostridia bacterium]|nr:23S rRNA (guanosine(2251)-2'-O)-methyltransferase RlmB [Clostridia bacterium]
MQQKRGRRPEESGERKKTKEFRIEFDLQEQLNSEADKLEGRNPVYEALKAGRPINKILVSRGEREGSIKQIVAFAREKGIVVQEVDRSILDNMSSTHSHQGVIAYAAVKGYAELDDILKIAADKGEPPFIVILDEINDAHNFGSILRTADAAGAHGVVIPKRRAVGLTPAVAKAAAGAVEYVPVARVTNISQTIDYLKKNNIWVIGTDLAGEKSFFRSDLKGPVALVIGSEGEGIGKLVRDKCDFVVSIPMKGQVTSLNASVAAAVVMYEIVRQRS